MCDFSSLFNIYCVCVNVRAAYLVVLLRILHRGYFCYHNYDTYIAFRIIITTTITLVALMVFVVSSVWLNKRDLRKFPFFV